MKTTSFKYQLLACIFLLKIHALGQVYDVLITESFDNTSGLSTDTGFGNEDKSCTTSDMFDVSATHTDPTDVTNAINYENGSVFCGSDINGISGVPTPSYLEIFNYTATDNDPISFVGKFAFAVSCGGGQDYNASDNLDIQYSTNGGSSWTTGLTLTGVGVGSSFSNADGDYFQCSDGTANVKGDMLDKEFFIGSGLMGQTIKIRINISGFTSSGEAFFLDEFRLVKTRLSLICEDFNNTSSLLSSSGNVFQTPAESALCANNSLYDVTANMASPSNATNCIDAEDGSFFVLTKRGGLPGVVDGEELEVLSYTVTNNYHISFRGNFASFADDQNSDNNIIVSYSTDNGANYTDALIFTGVDGPSVFHTPSDGTPRIGNYFLTKGFPIGSGLSGKTIKIKITFNKYDNGGDGIALDKFCLEQSINPISLPIELSSFDAIRENEIVRIHWNTVSEINNDFFEIQRSNDGLNWQTIEKVSGNGNSSRKIQYSTVDLHPADGKNYYRLKQVDFNGEYSYSGVDIVDFNTSTFYISPNNISQGEPIMVHTTPSAEKLTIFTINGTVLLQKDLSSSYSQQVSLNNTLAKGVYIMQLSSKYGKSLFQRFVIQ
ncbi:T9SS type A sorting domain-containing protein [Parvicella tangerina]|uniref:T9SS C-terminal target domain-containing protein n=1 Tax=Parvicella tangerina TaxID=2829795 RepID=A0A916JJS6_9FLAO|nr:T9SS type A sorting domain-containing protein [Parvicella tangerina]CAG5077384.1 hypothetical protein CRYO30217_00367 [Parvicella tangerina]